MAFCRNCGSPMGEDERFCPNCGQSVELVPQTTKAENGGANFFSSLLGMLKSFFSKDPFAGSALAAKSNGFEWAVIAGTFIIVFALGAMVTSAEAIGSLARSIAGTFSGMVKPGSYVRFGAVFGMSLVAALFIYGSVLGGTFLHVKIINKSKVSFMGVANMVAYSFIPVIAILIFNMLAGLIWMPIAIVLLITAICGQAALLYKGVRELNDGKETNFFLLLAVYCGVVLLILLTVYIVYLTNPSMYLKTAGLFGF